MELRRTHAPKPHPHTPHRMITRVHVALLTCLALASSGRADEIKRYCFGEWCDRIGYSEAVAVGNTLYLSGLVGEAETMEQCLISVLAQADAMLERFGLERRHILKEKIYTNNKDALRSVTRLRKEFYGPDRPAAVWIETESSRPKAWIEMELVLHIPDRHPLPDT